MTLRRDSTSDERWALAGPEWFDDLRRFWDDQRGGATLPDSDELFLADLCEIMPNLLLAYYDPLQRAFRIEFAGSITRGLMEESLVGQYPERAEPGTALSWLGAAYAGAGRMLPSGILQVRLEDLMAVHLPYRDARGRVGLILTALAQKPSAVARTATVVAFPDVGEEKQTAGT